MELISHDSDTQIRLENYEEIQESLVDNMNWLRMRITELGQVKGATDTMNKMRVKYDELQMKYTRVCKLVYECREKLKKEEAQ